MKVKNKFYLFCSIILIFYSGNILAIDSVSLALGSGNPNDLKLSRLAVQWDWHKRWFSQLPLNLLGYWDFSLAYAQNDGDWEGQHRSLWTIAAAPVFRIEPREPIFSFITPYFEGSTGPSFLSEKYLGSRNLGSQFAFQDLLGFGFSIGKQNRLDLSYHFLHYSNASLYHPNQGIDVISLFMMRYKF